MIFTFGLRQNVAKIDAKKGPFGGFLENFHKPPAGVSKLKLEVASWKLWSCFGTIFIVFDRITGLFIIDYLGECSTFSWCLFE